MQQIRPNLSKSALPAKAFELQSKHLSNALGQLKWRLSKMADLKRQGKQSSDPKTQELDLQSVELLATAKGGMRNVIDSVETLKRQCDTQRAATDDHNLTLQAHLYQISHYKKQIYACQEFKTPELDKVIEKAYERGEKDAGLTKLTDLSKGISEQSSDFTSSFAYMDQTFKERKDLSVRLQEAEKDKQGKLEEFKHKEQLLNDFPKILADLEQSTLPLQNYLGVQTTKNRTELVTISRLPKPLGTLYEKLSAFAKNYPAFELSVRVKGGNDPDSDSNQEIDRLYQQHDAQVLYNPANQFKALRRLQKGPNKGPKLTKTMPGILEASKQIKKDKKPSKTLTNAKKEKLAAAASLEEGEEGMIVSEAENSQASASSDLEFGTNPTEKKLLEKYDKYPEYLKITLKRPENLANLNLSMLSRVNSEKIIAQAFPVAFFIQLVPELNILTIALAQESENLSTDALLYNLIQNDDQGSQLLIDELDQIQSVSQERLYKWLHSLAGLQLDYSHASSSSASLGKKPSFVLHSGQVSHHVSTKLVAQRVWQRLLSAQILLLQVETLKYTKSFLPEVTQIINQQVAEFQARKVYSIRVKNFVKISARVFRLDLAREAGPFELRAEIRLMDGYPDQSCSFTISFVVPPAAKATGEEKLLTEFAEGQPVEQVARAVKAELEEFHTEYCDPLTHADFLFSMQVQKLKCCFAEICEAQEKKVDLLQVGFKFGEGSYTKRQ